MLRSLSLTFLLGISVWACGAPTPIPQPQSPAARVYRARCGVCHSVPHPRRHTMKQWRSVLAVMDSWMHKRKMSPLTGADRRTIVEYLQRNAR